MEHLQSLYFLLGACWSQRQHSIRSLCDYTKKLWLWGKDVRKWTIFLLATFTFLRSNHINAGKHDLVTRHLQSIRDFRTMTFKRQDVFLYSCYSCTSCWLEGKRKPKEWCQVWSIVKLTSEHNFPFKLQEPSSLFIPLMH